MSKRYDSDSDDDRSSDEDNGNFKRRRRRHSSSDEEDIVTTTLRSFDIPKEDKPVKVVDTQQQKQLIQKQKVLNQKLSKLPKYDDLFDDSQECVSNEQTEEITNNEETSLSTTEEETTKSDTKSLTSIEVSDDSVDVLAGGDTAEVPKSKDPRLNRMERFKTPVLSGKNLNNKINELLNNRKPLEAYNQLKAAINPLQLLKHRDHLIVMATDWFPSQIDNAYDPRSVFIEQDNLYRFNDLLRDVISCKVKSREFWEKLIHNIEKFINETRIQELPIYLAKLRWILVRDIRDYLKTEEVKISLKTDAIILDHKIKLDSKRQRHRKMIEDMYIPKPIINQNISQIAKITPQIVSKTEITSTLSNSVPIIIGNRRTAPQPVPKPLSVIDSNDMISPFQSSSLPLSSQTNPSEKRTISLLLDCFSSDQYFKMIQMLARHTRAPDNTFIENMGQALRKIVELYPTKSVFEIYQKIQDMIIINKNDITFGVDNKRLNDIIEKILKEFHETVIYNPKEWLLIKDATRSDIFLSNFKPKFNPFNESLVPIIHNIVIDCGYMSLGLVIDYTAIEQEIPLMSQNIILKDPRIELKPDTLPYNQEVYDLEETVLSKFSPIRSEGSSSPCGSPPSSASPSPPTCATSCAPSPPSISPSPSMTRPVASVAPQTVATNRIKLTAKYKDQNELKKIVRRVSISSDESDVE